MKLKLNELGRIAHPNTEYAEKAKVHENVFYFLNENNEELHIGHLSKEEADLWEKTFCEKVETYEEVIDGEFAKYINEPSIALTGFKKYIKKPEVKQRIKNALLNEEI